MHDIWNPWHGCRRKSEGCDNCYMFFLDRMRDKNGADIYRTKTKFNYPLQKDRQGNYKVKSGKMIRVCMTSDFFLEDTAAYAGFSACYFSRIFKQFTNYNFVKYLALQRIKRAQKLLADPDKSVTEISCQAGFRSISTFNRVFRQYRGCSPNEYRKYYLR